MVIGKVGDGELSRMNDFMKDEVRKHFLGEKPKGWLQYISWKRRRMRVKHFDDHNI